MTPERDIHERLEKLEKQNRTFRRLVVALLVTVGAVLLMGQAASKRHSVQAEEFILTDAAGKTRASWTMTKGDPTLAFYGSQGQPRMALFVEHDEPQIDLSAGKGSEVATVRPSLVELTDSTGRVVSLNMQPSVAGFSLEDASRVRAVFALNSDEPGLVLLDKDGKVATLLNDDQDGPRLSLWDAQGYHATLGVEGASGGRKTSAASLVLIDKNKNVVWKAP